MQDNSLKSTQEVVFIEKDLVNHNTGETVFKAGQYVPVDVYDNKLLEIYRDEIEKMFGCGKKCIMDDQINPRTR